MIRYSLRCKNGHEFEAWFRSSADYDEGSGTACPVCDSKKVEKALMAPSLGRASAAGQPGKPDRSDESGKSDKPERVKLAAAPDPRMKAMRAALKEIRQQVVDNADYVGNRFADEARKMHYNETDARAIYGEATSDEAKVMVEEGIEFLPLPSLPEDQN